MRRMNKANMINPAQKIAINTVELQLLLGCGRYTAVKIAESAGAKIRIGGRVLWNVEKVKHYVETLTEREA